MKSLMSIIILLAFTFLYFGCNENPANLTSSETEPMLEDCNRFLPFKGNLEGVAISLTDPYTPPVMKQNTFSGRASHTGRYDCVLKYWITYNQSFTGGTIYGIDGIDAILIAANGDKIKFDNATGQWSFRNGNPNLPGIIDGTFHATINGGTGRFKHATGYIDAVVEQEYTPGVDPTPTTGTWTGKIKYR